MAGAERLQSSRKMDAVNIILYELGRVVRVDNVFEETLIRQIGRVVAFVFVACLVNHRRIYSTLEFARIGLSIIISTSKVWNVPGTCLQ